MNFKNHDELIAKVKGKSNRVIVPGANNEEVLQACKMGIEYELISGGLLIGPWDQIKNCAKNVGINLDIFEIKQEKDMAKMSDIAVESIRDGKGDFLVKGLIDTKLYMKAILRKDIAAVKEASVLSHFVLFETANYNKIFALTDAAIMIKPSLEEKVKILNNAVETMRQLGVNTPKVSVVCPVEKPNPKIPSTIDAQALVAMNREGKIPNCVVEGPYDVYITFSKKLAEEKGIKDASVPGDVDIVLLPDLDSANPTYKSISFFAAGMKSSTILVGANFPVILPSRTDSPMTKLHSIALAGYLKQVNKAAAGK